MFIGQLQGKGSDPYRKCVFRNDKALPTPQGLCIFKAAGGDAAAGIQLHTAARFGNAGFFKGFPFCRFGDGSVLLFPAAGQKLPDSHIPSSEYAELCFLIPDAIGKDQDLVRCSRHRFFLHQNGLCQLQTLGSVYSVISEEISSPVSSSGKEPSSGRSVSGRELPISPRSMPEEPG